MIDPLWMWDSEKHPIVEYPNILLWTTFVTEHFRPVHGLALWAYGMD